MPLTEIDNAVKGAISGIFAATGQTRVAGSRLLVQQSIHDQFVEKLVAFAKIAKMGDPMSLDTQVGPVTSLPQYNKVLNYIDIAKAEGPKTALGGAKGTAPECGDGWFVSAVPVSIEHARHAARHRSGYHMVIWMTICGNHEHLQRGRSQSASE